MSQPRKSRVLCVDDEPHVLRALQWLLQKDFEIHTAGSAAEGLRLLGAHDFDVVVSDQRMPGVTGVEFLQQVRATAPRAMRILLTGYSDLDAMVSSVNESEVFRFITKPWDVRTLPQLVAEAADIARSTPHAAAMDGGKNVVPMPQKPPAPPPDPAAKARRAKAAPVAVQQVTTVAVRATECVLVVDGNVEVHDAVVDAVGTTLRVQHAFDLAEAVRVLKTTPVGVMLTDVLVGKADATRLVRQLKQSRPETVSVVFGSQQDAKTVMGLINEGQVFRFIPKPVKQSFIRVVIEAAMQRHRELVATPELRKRYATEKVAPGSGSGSGKAETGDGSTPSAGPDPAPARSAAPDPAGAEEALSSSVSSGFRSLFAR